MTAAVLATCSLVLCISGTLGKGTLCKYPSFRVPTNRLSKDICDLIVCGAILK